MENKKCTVAGPRKVCGDFYLKMEEVVRSVGIGNREKELSREPVRGNFAVVCNFVGAQNGKKPDGLEEALLLLLLN